MAVSLLDRRLLFVTGKGGVGKTTVASGLAVMAARAGRRTLVCETDGHGSLAAAFELSRLSFEPTKVQSGLWAMAMDTEESLKEYLRLQLRVPLVSRLGPLARTFDVVATAAPGVKELLTVGKLCWEVRQRHYDLVVVDAAPSGQVVGQLDAPKAINDLVHMGKVRNQTRWMLDLLEDPTVTGVVITTTPEEMPVNETCELAAELAAKTNVDLAAIVVNRVLPELFTRSEQDRFEGLREQLDDLDRVAGPAMATVLDAADLATNLRRTRSEHLADLRAKLEAIPFLYLPEQFTRLEGLRSTATIADRLAEELL
ncbi:MAG: putative Chromosome partitioning-like ATPase [Acidimicrobiia bacterium]|nr:putative Chromosome partitioning-like ATPase [Acidimicrobiia bacterium]